MKNSPVKNPTQLRIRLQDADGKVYHWTIRRVPHTYNTTTRLAISGWEFTDHDGYSRFSEGNWAALLPYFRLVVENYGFTLLSELS